MIKQCKQCGKDFEAKPRHVFCQECKKIRKAEQKRQSYARCRGHIVESKPNPPKPEPEPLPEFNTCDTCGNRPSRNVPA